MSKIRLDEWLVENGHYASRARARDAILRGCVSMDGNGAIKPSRNVLDPDSIKIDDPAAKLVSRAAIKLEFGLKETGYTPKDKIAVDIGASTGGFCQILLNEGAKKVFGVDVGHDQMDQSLIENPKLINLAGINARELTLEDLDNIPPQFISCDVSFISLTLALPPVLQMAEQNTQGIFLIKPQFEVGKDGLGKGGVVREEGLAIKTSHSIRDWLDNFPGWNVTHFMPSPLKGGDGNKEFLMAAIKND